MAAVNGPPVDGVGCFIGEDGGGRSVDYGRDDIKIYGDDKISRIDTRRYEVGGDGPAARGRGRDDGHGPDEDRRIGGIHRVVLSL